MMPSFSEVISVMLNTLTNMLCLSDSGSRRPLSSDDPAHINLGKQMIQKPKQYEKNEIDLIIFRNF